MSNQIFTRKEYFCCVCHSSYLFLYLKGILLSIPLSLFMWRWDSYSNSTVILFYKYNWHSTQKIYIFARIIRVKKDFICNQKRGLSVVYIEYINSLTYKGEGTWGNWQYSSNLLKHCFGFLIKTRHNMNTQEILFSDLLGF